ncbi:MAG: hypothetical protein LBI37_02715 [Puniceicoccales bacterium]|nr:hypothetical protein [Puniceicoccales bacterium]
MDALVVILAGGVGERLWPLSTPERPKYLLKIGGISLIELAFRRGLLLGDAANIFVSTSQSNCANIQKAIPMLPKANIIAEPFVKNTATAICLSNEVLYHRFGSRPIIFMPSDSVIDAKNSFVDALVSAMAFVSAGNKMTVIGVSPWNISTQYGYIRIGSAMDRDKKIFSVDRFVEKPDRMTAKSYVQSDKYLWNTGMVISTTGFIQEAFRLYAQNIYEDVAKYIDGDNRAYGLSKGASFDRVILEKLKTLSVMVGDFGWEDVGSFEILAKYSSAKYLGLYKILNFALQKRWLLQPGRTGCTPSSIG